MKFHIESPWFSNMLCVLVSISHGLKVFSLKEGVITDPADAMILLS